jgi:hypothetical protein
MTNFVCRDCGREIFAFAPREDEPRDLCAHCAMFPGWRDDPELRRMFDPGAATRAPDEAKRREGATR